MDVYGRSSHHLLITLNPRNRTQVNRARGRLAQVDLQAIRTTPTDPVTPESDRVNPPAPEL